MKMSSTIVHSRNTPSKIRISVKDGKTLVYMPGAGPGPILINDGSALDVSISVNVPMDVPITIESSFAATHS